MQVELSVREIAASQAQLKIRATESSQFLHKACLTVLCSIGFCVPYFTLGHFPLFEPQTLPLLWIDRLFPFDPEAVWFYQSAYVLIFCAAWLLQGRSEVNAWVYGFLAICVPGFLVLALFPISCPRPANFPHTGMFGLLTSYDGTVNCMPSLHAALSFYSACIAYWAICSKIVYSLSSRLFLGLGLSAWIMLILYSTIATKQHYSLDLLPGLGLGFIAYRVFIMSIGTNNETTY